LRWEKKGNKEMVCREVLGCGIPVYLMEEKGRKKGEGERDWVKRWIGDTKKRRGKKQRRPARAQFVCCS